jgi:hypothetical protein
MEVNWDCKLTNWPGAMVLLRAEPGESVLLARGGVMEDNDPWFEVIGVMGGNADDDFLDDEFPGSETSLGLAALVVEERAAVANGLCALKEIRLGSISDFECGSGIRGPDLGRFGSDTGETMGGLPRSLIGSSSSDFSSNVATCSWRFAMVASFCFKSSRNASSSFNGSGFAISQNGAAIQTDWS